MKDGVGNPVIFMDGFLSEKDSNEEVWKKELADIYPNAPLYRLHWKSKTIDSIFGLSSVFLSRSNLVAAAASLPVGALYSWREAKKNAEEAGIRLGTYLKDLKSNRVVLCGHSLGTRVIYHALMYLYDQWVKSQKDVFNVVEHVHLLGGAVNIDACWENAQKIPKQGINNYYSHEDDVLHYLYKTIERQAIGSCEVDGAMVQNFNVTTQVKGHFEFIKNFSNYACKD